MLKCKDVMTTPVVSVKPTDTIEEVTSRLLRHHVSGFPVIDEEGHAVGVISEFDLLRILYDTATKNNQVHEYMTTEIFTIEGDAQLTEAANLFLQHRMRRLPVVENGKVIGILSHRELIRFIRDVRVRVAREVAAKHKPKNPNDSSTEAAIVASA